MYIVHFPDEAEREIEGLDPPVRRRIMERLAWLAQNIEQIRPEPLTGSLAGLFKFRVGDYRVLYDVFKDDQIILIHAVGHRRDIYKKPYD
jgi:mRNA interferase RelE/StbE